MALFAALGLALLLRSAPEAARWSLMICVMGFIGATMRLRRLDAGF